MLIRFFNVFVNFTAANSRFLHPPHKCKHLFGGENTRSWSPPCHFETQMADGSQSRISGWQITIFDFLGAQLDFLAIFSKKPIITTKYGIFINLSKLNDLSKYYNNSLNIDTLICFHGQKSPYFTTFKNSPIAHFPPLFSLFREKELKLDKKRLFDQKSA